LRHDDHREHPVRTPGHGCRTITGAATQEPTFRQLLRPFWFVGALLMMLDGLTTYIALTFFAEEGAREGNPIGVWAIEHLGVAGMCTAQGLDRAWP
jgi:hypothetical protein